MTAVDDRRLVAEPIMAYKTARLDRTGGPGAWFQPLTADGAYGIDETATCRPVFGTRSHQFLGEFLGTRGGHRVRGGHRAPDPTCACGFYARKERRTPGRHTVALRVALSGTVIVHEHGYRAQRQQVVAVEIPRDPCWCGQPAEGIYPELLRALPGCTAHASAPLSTLAGELGIDVAWCEPVDDHLAEYTAALNRSFRILSDMTDRMVRDYADAFRTVFQGTWTPTDETSGRDGAKVDRFIKDEASWDAAVADPVHPLEAKRHRDEARRRRLERLAGPQRPPRTTGRKGARR